MDRSSSGVYTWCLFIWFKLHWYVLPGDGTMLKIEELVGFTATFTATLDALGEYTNPDTKKVHKTRLLKHIMFNGYMVQDHAWVTENPLLRQVVYGNEFKFKTKVKRYGKTKYRFTNISKVTPC